MERMQARVEKAADDEVIENDERSEAEVWQKGKGRDG
jgi:hypothetical protein